MSRSQGASIGQALLAALLFGASAPAAKLLLGELEPVLLAAFLYLGSGLGVLLFKAAQQVRRPAPALEAPIGRSDWGWLAGSVLTGGIVAPIVLLLGLRHTPAATASLLLNFEGVATAVIAGVVFKEAISRRAVRSIACVTAASILLSWNVHGRWGLSMGALGILAACVLWGIDNNLTRCISAKDPLVIVMVKGLGAGSFSLLLALSLGYAFPAPLIVVGALVLGTLSYGASIVLFIHAMRALGAARTSALFGIAPWAGVALSLILLQEAPNLLFVAALPLVFAGTLELFREQHAHPHHHAAESHEHRHSHDDGHHGHDHPDLRSLSQSHSHWHTHPPVNHAHPHMPDIHHRHGHRPDQGGGQSNTISG